MDVKAPDPIREKEEETREKRQPLFRVEPQKNGMSPSKTVH